MYGSLAVLAPTVNHLQHSSDAPTIGRQLEISSTGESCRNRQPFVRSSGGGIDARGDNLVLVQVNNCHFLGEGLPASELTVCDDLDGIESSDGVQRRSVIENCFFKDGQVRLGGFVASEIHVNNWTLK